VLFGVSGAGVIRGQEVSDNTLREVGNELVRLEPPAHIVLTRVPVTDSHDVLVLETTAQTGAPYTFNGRAYRRVGTSTGLLPQGESQPPLLDTDHAQQRGENKPATGYDTADLDHDEIRRRLTEAVEAGRLDSTVTGVTERLQKLPLLAGDRLLQAAV